MTRGLGLALVTLALLSATAAPVAAPHAVDAHFAGLLNAPPTVPHVADAAGAWHAPFIYRWQLANQLEQRYDEDRSTRVPLAWFSGGHVVRSSDEAAAPLLLLGADSYGRDVFTRLLFGARTSLGLAVTEALAAMLVGTLLGGVAGFAGGVLDDVLMRAADFVMVLPAPQVFALLAAIFAVVGAPFVARGVRAIVRSERRLDYAVAAQALGASDARLLVRHLLPSARGFIAVQITLLIPAFIIAEATLSYVGLGFPDPVASWGTMLQEASGNIRVFADFPWLLSPAAAMFLVVLGVNLVLHNSRPEGLRDDRGAGVKSVL